MGAGTNGAFFRKGKQNLLEGELDWRGSGGAGQAFSCALVDLSEWNTHVFEINGAADNGGGLIRITTAAAHGFATGEHVHLTQVGGVSTADGTWVITVVSSTQFDLQLSSFSGSYTSGGYAIGLDDVEFFNSIDAAAVPDSTWKAVITANANRTATLGVLDADDLTFPGAAAQGGNAADALLIYRSDTPAGTNDEVLLIITEATGLPVIPNNGNITVAWSNLASKIAQL